MSLERYALDQDMDSKWVWQFRYGHAYRWRRYRKWARRKWDRMHARRLVLEYQA